MYEAMLFEEYHDMGKDYTSKFNLDNPETDSKSPKYQIAVLQKVKKELGIADADIEFKGIEDLGYSIELIKKPGYELPAGIQEAHLEYSYGTGDIPEGFFTSELHKNGVDKVKRMGLQSMQEIMSAVLIYYSESLESDE
jgi:biotin operon repressor